MQEFFTCAVKWSVVKRAIKVALIITPILTVFNHFAEIMALEMGFAFWVQVALTFSVPYFVSTYSSAMTALEVPRMQKEEAQAAD